MKPYTLLFLVTVLLPKSSPLASTGKPKRPKKIAIDITGGISSPSTPSTDSVVWSSDAGDLRKDKPKTKKDRSPKSTKKGQIAFQRRSSISSTLSVKTVKRGSKQVTVVSPITSLTSPKALLKALKSKLATGGTIAGDAIEIQGDHKQAVESHLKSQLPDVPRGGFTAPAPAAENAKTAAFPVYLELTDAYGLLFNANYALLYSRLLPPSLRIMAVQGMKFSKPIKLGDVVEVQVKEGEGGGYICKASVGGEICNTATVRVEQGVILESRLGQGEHHDLAITAYADELGEKGKLDAVSIMKWFERSRTEIIGGPAGIRRGAEENVAIVVAKASLDLDEGATIEAGEALRVTTDVTVRGGRIVIFRHEVLRGDGEGPPLASGDFTCLATKADTGEPRTVPGWMLELT